MNKLRKIIHVDCDCFYAAVEMRDNPSLIGKPIAVGGSTSRRGVLSTCNYEARAYGLHSAMPTAQALKLCPDVILLPHRFDAYKEASNKVNDIYRRYTEIIQPLSLDEAYLDVSEVDMLHGSATLIAQDIRQAIEKEVGITASAGIAPNKFLAKVASDWNKPNGQFVITPDQIADFMVQLPVKKIPGVGKKTAERLVIELRDKLSDWQLAVAGAAATSDSTQQHAQAQKKVDEVESALLALGYKSSEVSQIISALAESVDFADTSTTELIRLALKQVNG